MVRPFRHFSLSPEIDKSQYEILIRSKNFHLTNLRVSVILAIKFKQVHAVNERKSEVRSLREPVDGEPVRRIRDLSLVSFLAEGSRLGRMSPLRNSH